MKKFLLASLAVGSALAAISPAVAAQGCGPGFHRNPWGHCRPNDRDIVAAGPGVLIVGRHYDGRGWWDGHRYWQHRYRWHNDWRYR